MVSLDRSSGRFATEFIPTVLHPRPEEPRQRLLAGWEELSNKSEDVVDLGYPILHSTGDQAAAP